MKGRCEMTGYHTRWARPQDVADDPERIAIREALAFGKALYDIRTALGLTVAELAMRASLTGDDIERIEEGGTEPTIPLLRRLAALNADVRPNPFLVRFAAELVLPLAGSLQSSNRYGPARPIRIDQCLLFASW
jgi:transcriptional regulator with XRE-family HTH domain